MISALLYLQWHSTVNRVVTRVKRLKKPKYLFGLIAGGLYCYFYFFRFLFQARRPSGPMALPEVTPELTIALELLGALALFVILLSAWIFPHERAALNFTEAEVSFLFPAPVKRRTLIHYKLLRSQWAILFTTLIMALLTNRIGRGGPALAMLAGWWVILSMLNLHFLGASFARTKLMDAGVTTWRRRGIVFGLLALVAGVGVAWGWQAFAPPQPGDFAGFKTIIAYAKIQLETGPAPWLLYPLRLVVRPFLAHDAGEFLRAIGPALALLGAHYIWVMRSNVAFEEASLALAQRRAEAVTAFRRGTFPGTKHQRRRDPFLLRPTGSPAIALLWKNLIGAGSVFTSRTVVLLGIIVCVPALIIGVNLRGSDLVPAIGLFLLMGITWSLLIGPQVLRHDFRSDLRNADLLKLYPLAGWRIVLGELLAPAVILTVIQWLALLVAAAIIHRIPGNGPVIPVLTRVSIALAAAMLLPMLNLISLLIPNAAVLLFPSWFQSGQDATQGIEATGQRLIFMLGQTLVFMISLLPAAIAFAAVFFLGRLAVNWVYTVPFAGLAAALMLALEVGVGVMLLGKLFDKFDLSAEAQ